jgi:hypothetical protein
MLRLGIVIWRLGIPSPFKNRWFLAQAGFGPGWIWLRPFSGLGWFAILDLAQAGFWPRLDLAQAVFWPRLVRNFGFGSGWFLA